MIIEQTSPHHDTNGNTVEYRVLIDVLKREVIAREAGEGRIWMYAEDGGGNLVNMSLGAFREAYEDALSKDNMGI